MAAAIQLPQPLQPSPPDGGITLQAFNPSGVSLPQPNPFTPAAASEAIIFVAPAGRPRGWEASGPSHSSWRVPGMKLGAACLLCLLLTCLTLPVAHGRIREHSMEIRSKESRSKGLPAAYPLPPAPSASPDSAAFGGRGPEGGGSLCRSKGLL